MDSLASGAAKDLKNKKNIEAARSNMKQRHANSNFE